jgi:hypothetical protein
VQFLTHSRQSSPQGEGEIRQIASISCKATQNWLCGASTGLQVHGILPSEHISFNH